MEKNLVIQNRLTDMQKVYESITGYIDDLPDSIPDKVKEQIKHAILGDSKLKDAMNCAASQRPPRLCILAPTAEAGTRACGAAAACGCADAGDEGFAHYIWEKDGYTIMEAMAYNRSEEFEDDIFISYNPDMIILVCDEESMDTMDELLKDAVKLKKLYYDRYLTEIPFLPVIDGINMKNRLKLTAQCSSMLRDHNMSSVKPVAISSEEGKHIRDLTRALEENIMDPQAKAGLKMALHLDEIMSDLANHIVDIFTGLAGTIALTPIPIADLYVLVTIQAVMVGLIAILSGRQVTIETAKEFMLSLGGVGAAGLGCRAIAQQASKLLNGVIPGAGSVVSTTVAASGTKAMGKTAIKYYLKGEK